MPTSQGRSIGVPLRPSLAMAGGALLAMVAGYVDAVVVARAGRAVTHVTGSVAGMGAELAGGSWRAALAAVSVVAAFVLGACVCGLIIHGPQLRLGRHYGVAMMVQGVLLALAAGVGTLGGGRWLLLCAALAAVAAGLQNAMASTYMGLIVRTTHLTGVATDLGYLLGARLRGQTVEPWRFVLLVLLLAGFLAGVTLGAMAAQRLGLAALWAAAGPVGAAGLAYYIWRVRTRGERRNMWDTGPRTT